MKNLHHGMLLAMLCLSLPFSSCYQRSICFHNPIGKTAKVEIDNYKMEVLAFSTRCIDLYEGSYEYKVKNNGDKWEEEVGIRSCREEKVELRKCESC